MHRKQPQTFKQSDLIYAGNLPKEMIQLIADYLDLKEFGSLLSVDKSHYLLANQYNSFWKQAAIEKISAKARISYPRANEDRCVANIQSLPDDIKDKNYRFEIAKLYFEMKNQNASEALAKQKAHYNRVENYEYNDELSGNEKLVATNTWGGRKLAALGMPFCGLIGLMLTIVIADSISKSHQDMPEWAGYVLLAGLVLTGCAVGSLPLTIPVIRRCIMNARIEKSSMALSRLDDVVVKEEKPVEAPTETTSLIPKI